MGTMRIQAGSENATGALELLPTLANDKPLEKY
jgi:hypothetical protein